jgi:hypothetical protein
MVAINIAANKYANAKPEAQYVLFPEQEIPRTM